MSRDQVWCWILSFPSNTTVAIVAHASDPIDVINSVCDIWYIFQDTNPKNVYSIWFWNDFQTSHKIIHNGAIWQIPPDLLCINYQLSCAYILLFQKYNNTLVKNCDNYRLRSMMPIPLDQTSMDVCVSLHCNCTSRMHVMNHNWSARKQHLHSVTGIVTDVFPESKWRQCDASLQVTWLSCLSLLTPPQRWAV